MKSKLILNGSFKSDSNPAPLLEPSCLGAYHSEHFRRRSEQGIKDSVRSHTVAKGFCSSGFPHIHTHTVAYVTFLFLPPYRGQPIEQSTGCVPIIQKVVQNNQICSSLAPSVHVPVLGYQMIATQLHSA